MISREVKMSTLIIFLVTFTQIANASVFVFWNHPNFSKFPSKIVSNQVVIGMNQGKESGYYKIRKNYRFQRFQKHNCICFSCLEARSFMDEIEAEKRPLSIGKTPISPISIFPYQKMLQQKSGRTLAAMLI